jgi:hypothetical protein
MMYMVGTWYGIGVGDTVLVHCWPCTCYGTWLMVQVEVQVDEWLMHGTGWYFIEMHIL